MTEGQTDRKSLAVLLLVCCLFHKIFAEQRKTFSSINKTYKTINIPRGKQENLTITKDVVKSHWPMIDVTDVRHAAVNVKTFNKHPAE